LETDLSSSNKASQLVELTAQSALQDIFTNQRYVAIQPSLDMDLAIIVDEVFFQI